MRDGPRRPNCVDLRDGKEWILRSRRLRVRCIPDAHGPRLGFAAEELCEQPTEFESRRRDSHEVRATIRIGRRTILTLTVGRYSRNDLC